jgi:DNA-binding MarR family transcriptional regulator
MSPHMTESDAEQLDSLRRANIGRLLTRAQREFTGRAVRELRAGGHADLSFAHASILIQLDTAGTRVTTIADRAGMTKQGAGQLVSDLERVGYVTREPDPRDRRAALVRFTPAGLVWLRAGLEVIAEIEADYARLLGSQGLESLRAALLTLLEREERPTTSER